MVDAQLNGIALDMETISDGFGKSVARRHIPFSDKTLLRSMGMKERTIRLRCYFWGETYETHKDLLKLLWGNTEFELNHPEYGLLKGEVVQINVRDDERLDTAEVDLDFVVGDSKAPVARTEDIQGEAEGLLVTGLAQAQTEYRDRLILDSVLPVEVVDMPLDEKKPTILEQLAGNVSTGVRTYVKNLDASLKAVNDAVAQVTAPVDSIMRDIDLVMGIPGRVTGVFAGMMDKQVAVLSSLRSAPSRFVDSLVSSLTRFKGYGGLDLFPGGSGQDEIVLPDAPTSNLFLSVASLSSSAAVGGIFGEDEVLRNQRLAAEGVQGFDDVGNFLEGDAVGYPMNVREIESSLAKVRQVADAATAANREVGAVKLLSDRLLKHVVQVKLAREKVINVEVENEMPLHLVCLKYGLPYKAAERIMLINRIAHPNFTQGRIDIYES